MVHTDRLKPCVRGEGVELFYFRTAHAEEEQGEAPLGEWNVDRILAHRWVDGKPQFLTKWEGADPGEETWEPVGHFVHRYSYKLPLYCKAQGLSLDLVEHLTARPTAE